VTQKGVEPSIPNGQRILSAFRIPIPTLRHPYYTIHARRSNIIVVTIDMENITLMNLSLAFHIIARTALPRDIAAKVTNTHLKTIIFHTALHLIYQSS
jgi:hypothetical protein